MTLAVLVTLCLVGLTFAQPPGNLIVNLPGQPAGGTPMYSGYINVGNGHNYFYWFVESANKPASDPLILWLNGGPGCSSLGGFMSENGPYSPDENGNLIPNPYSWNTVANVLYLESPAGVGFSYCNGGCPTFTDNSTANDNYAFIQLWFQQYPAYAKNDFYIWGESYAGHYIPELVNHIYQNLKTNPNVPPQSNFRGFGTGNPLTDELYDFGNGLTVYYQTHGILSMYDNNQNDVTGNFDPYDILDDVCNAQYLRKYIRFPHPVFNPEGKNTHKRYVPNTPACIDNYVASYLNTVAVQNAIHAQPTQWTDCANIAYTFSHATMLPLYANYLNNTSWKIWVYSGDADTVLNFYSTEQWVWALGRPVVQHWQDWSYQRINGSGLQVAGWRVVFDRFTYTTIKGAGHMVPWFQPAPALQMLNDYFNQK